MTEYKKEDCQVCGDTPSICDRCMEMLGVAPVDFDATRIAYEERVQYYLELFAEF